jgi:hypothetical protein
MTTDPNNEDVHINLLRELNSEFVPVLRVYVHGCGAALLDSLSPSLAGYKLFKRTDTHVLTQQIRFKCKESFLSECNRLAKLIGSVCSRECTLDCIYDGSRSSADCYSTELSIPAAHQDPG